MSSFPPPEAAEGATLQMQMVHLQGRIVTRFIRTNGRLARLNAFKQVARQKLKPNLTFRRRVMLITIQLLAASLCQD